MEIHYYEFGAGQGPGRWVEVAAKPCGKWGKLRGALKRRKEDLYKVSLQTKILKHVKKTNPKLDSHKLSTR